MKTNLAHVRLNPPTALHKGTTAKPIIKGDAAQNKRLADLEKAVQHHEVLIARIVARINLLDGAGDARQQPATPGNTSMKRGTPADALRKDAPIKPVRDGNGSINEAATLIKGIHKRGAR